MTKPTRDSEATKGRLLAAATSEFAAHGIAGARVDRIASRAQSNKAQIYHYFGSKDALFDAVFAHMATGIVREIPLNADNLPDYAGSLFDHYEKFPETVRLSTWHRLERSDRQAIPAVVEAARQKVAAIREAQIGGTVTAEWDAVSILDLVSQVSLTWASLSPEYLALSVEISGPDRREVVVSAVRALVSPKLD